MDAKILELIRTNPRYSYEGYDFVCEAVTFTQDRLGRIGEDADDDEDDPERHVSGEELLRGACDLAIREFGMMAPTVFRHWGIRETDDVGEMVFHLIEAGKLSKSERDDPEQFRAIFDLEKALAEGFSLTIGDAPRRGER